MNILKTSKIAAAAVSLAVVAGCTTATPYKPLGAPGPQGGYATQQLDQTHFRVSFVGNTLTSRERVENFLLYRAAELTLQQNASCFTIVNRDTDRDVRLRAHPYGPTGVGYYRGWAPYWQMRGPWGMHHYDPWMGGPFYPGRYDIDTVDSYRAMADIAISRTCAATPATFNAAEVVRNLQPYVMMQPARY